MAASYRRVKAEEIERATKEYSGKLDRSSKCLSVILAGGFGKRIKSERPKVLHEVWGEASVKRVSDAAKKGLRSANQVMVVGIGAMEVMEVIGQGILSTFGCSRAQPVHGPLSPQDTSPGSEEFRSAWRIRLQRPIRPRNAIGPGPGRDKGPASH